MAKLNDLSDSEKLKAKVNSKGIVMCPKCEKNPAIITEYGMIRNCLKCGENKKERYGMAIIMEGERMKNY